MIFKKIPALIIAISMITTNALAFTPYRPLREDETSKEQSAKEETVETEKNNGSSLTQVKPRDLQYQLFEQILDLYVEKHLYDFTEEQVLHKFFEDFLNDNPMYFPYIMNYILGTMDPYSAYHTASSHLLEPESEATGFGFTISDTENGTCISEIIKGSNAEDSGFMKGDRFISVAGINVEHQSYEVTAAILANPNLFIQSETNGEDAKADETPRIDFVVDRNGEKVSLRCAKGSMYMSQVGATVDENNGKPAAYIQLLSFLGDDTQQEFIDYVTEYAESGIKHLTIDLRDNGGGSVDMALSMVETFLEKGELICYYDDNVLEEPEPIYSTTDKVSFDSITILINEHSASASELFTSILQDKGLAKVVGTKSFGKSLGQNVFSLYNGDYITITSYQMLNEKLESYDGIGIIPDLAIKDVEMCYVLPELGVFNHQNYVEIKEGEYSDVTKALEDRMEIMGLLRNKFCDGIFDEHTKTALFVYQTIKKISATGYVDYDTVSAITRDINNYKPLNYFDDTQYQVAMIVHHSFSQGKRLVKEKEKLRTEQAEMISERDARLDAEYDAQIQNSKND